MNQTKYSIESIIKELKEKGIRPYTTYYQRGSNSSYYKNFPMDSFISLAKAEEQRFPNESENEIQFIVLGDNYQYKRIILQSREIIDILYPIKQLEWLDNGVHYFILDDDQQLHKLESLEKALEKECYIRVYKKNNKIRQIQKRPLMSIWKTTYVYWNNNNLRKEINERLDILGNILYRAISLYNKNGEYLKNIFFDPITQCKEVYKIINEPHPIFKIDIFNRKGIRTNYIVGSGLSDEYIQNNYLDEKGCVIKTTNGMINLLHSTSPYLGVSRRHFLPINFEKTQPYFSELLFNKIPLYSDDILEQISAELAKSTYSDINLQYAFYLPCFFSDKQSKQKDQDSEKIRMTLVEVEKQNLDAEYIDLVKVEIDETNRCKTITREKWHQESILLKNTPFISLENGVHFFEHDAEGNIYPLENIEFAITLPSYLRVEKKMTRVVSTIKKTLVQKSTEQFQYYQCKLHKASLKIITNKMMSPVGLEVILDEQGDHIQSQVLINQHGNILESYDRLNDHARIHAEITLFSEEGSPIKQIIITKSGDIENRHIDKNGQPASLTKATGVDNFHLPFNIPIPFDQFIDGISQESINDAGD